jgi:hypothetical protein
MPKFGIRLTFIIEAENQQDAAQQSVEFMTAGTEGSGVEVDVAAIGIDHLPVEMGGTGNSPDSKPQLSAAERARREMIRKSCDRRMN